MEKKIDMEMRAGLIPRLYRVVMRRFRFVWGTLMRMMPRCTLFPVPQVLLMIRPSESGTGSRDLGPKALDPKP